MPAYADAVDGLELGQFEVQLQGLLIHALVLAVLLVDAFFDALPLPYFLVLHHFSISFLQKLPGDPLVVPPIQGLVVDVVLVAVLILLRACGVGCVWGGLPLASLQLRMRALNHLLAVSLKA
jgi:hypothetical protein